MVHDNKNLAEIIDRCGSRYSATVFVGKEARKLSEKYNNVISHAEALSWILSGCVPEDIKQYETKLKQREERQLWYAKDYLFNIVDNEVKESVLESLKKSKLSGHLIYYYRNVFDKDRQARVRILTNKLWDEMRQEGL